MSRNLPDVFSIEAQGAGLGLRHAGPARGAPRR